MTLQEAKNILKIGDKIQFESNIFEYNIFGHNNIIRIGRVISMDDYQVLIEPIPVTDNFMSFTFQFNLNYGLQIKILNNDNEKTMTLKEKFVLTLTREPQKSFRKAGITDGDDLLTQEGERVFLSWLLHKKYAEDFKKEVVNNLLEEEKEKKDS